MTVSARKITAFAKLVAGLADTPNLGSTALLKQWFDSSPEELRVAVNGLIDDLIATAAGASGTEQIGSAPISGVAGATAYAQLVDLKAQLNGVVLGQIPPDMLTAALNRQAIINGNFDIAQRGTSFTNPVNNAYTLDRFSLANGMTGTFPTSIIHSQQQLVPGDIPNAYYYYRINSNAAGSGYGANDVYAVIQKIENGVRYLAGAGKKVTLSFWARSSIAGKKLGIYAQQIYGTGGSPTAGESIIGNNFTLTTTWTKYTVTISTNTLVGKVFGTNNDDNFVVGIVPMWGTGVYAGLVGSSGIAETFGGSGTIDIAQVQLNAGNVILLFQPRSFAEELLLCQRYYEKSYSYTTNPGTVGLETHSDIAIANTTTELIVFGRFFKVLKRVVPTITLYSYNGTTGKISSYNGTADIGTSILMPRNNIRGILNITDTVASFTVGNYYWYGWVADAEL